MSDPRGEPEIVPLSRIERIVARRLGEAKATIPEIVLRVGVDMTAAMAFRQQLGADAGSDGISPSVDDIVTRASTRLGSMVRLRFIRVSTSELLSRTAPILSFRPYSMPIAVHSPRSRGKHGD